MFSSMILVTLATTGTFGQREKATGLPPCESVERMERPRVDVLVKDISNGLEKVPICIDVGLNEDLPPKFNVSEHVFRLEFNLLYYFKLISHQSTINPNLLVKSK